MATISSTKMETIANIYNMYANEVKAFLMSYTHNEMAAEDMLHDLFVKVMSLDVVNEQTAKSLLFVTARRMMIDHARHQAFVRQYEKDAMAEMERMDSYSVERKIDGERILSMERACIANMSERSAKVYQLCFHEELSAKEIAEHLHMNQRTVEGHIYRSRKELRDYMRKVM